jgi:hypothetical protein
MVDNKEEKRDKIRKETRENIRNFSICYIFPS